MGAGEGTRMWPLSSLVNKHLLKLGGKPVIRHIWEKLSYEPKPPHFALINDITIICLKKDLKDYQWEFRDVDVNFFPIEENTGTASEFALALYGCSEPMDGDVLLHYGDTITDLNYKEFFSDWHTHGEKSTIAVTENIRHDYSKVDCGTNCAGAVSLIQSIQEKPYLSFPSWTGIGIFKVREIMDEIHMMPINENAGLDFAYDVFPQMVKKGNLYAYQYDGQWFDVGNLRSYQRLYQEYQNKDLNL